MAKLNLEELKKLIRETNGDKIFLTESSYNRIRDHIEGGAAFVIITSDRHERTLPEYKGMTNKEAYRQLKKDFKEAGFPFTEMKGGFKETTKTVQDPETGETKQIALEEPVYVTENSIIATTHERGDIKRETLDSTEQLRKLAAELAKKYNQEAFIFGQSATTETGGTFKYIRALDQGGKEIKEEWAQRPWTSVQTVEKDEDFWSRVKGKHFQLTEKKKTSQPRSWIEALKKSRSGETW
jgi:hypothetical protein